MKNLVSHVSYIYIFSMIYELKTEVYIIIKLGRPMTSMVSHPFFTNKKKADELCNFSRR